MRTNFLDYMKGMVLLGALMLSQLGIAGQEGHGGQVLACFTTSETAKEVYDVLMENRNPDVKIKKDPLNKRAFKELADRENGGKVELIDLYLARRQGLDNDQVRLIDGTGPYKEIVNERLKTIGNVNYLFSKQLLAPQKIIGLENWVASPASVIELDDAMLAMIFETNCLPLQIANQQIISANVAMVNFDKRLFDLMNPVDQAALVFHEWVYNLMIISHQAADARSTQILVKTIFAKDFVPANAAKVSELFQNLGLYKDNIITCSKDSNGYDICENYVGYDSGNSRWDFYYHLNTIPDNGFRRGYAGDLDPVRSRQGLPDDVENYFYSRPVEYLGINFHELSLLADQTLPFSGKSKDPITGVPLPEIDGYVEAYTVNFKKENVESYVIKNSRPWTYQNINIPAYSSVTLDSQKRIISISDESISINSLKCIGANFSYVDGIANPILKECRLSGSQIFQGLNLIGGTLQFNEKGEIDTEKKQDIDLRLDSFSSYKEITFDVSLKKNGSKYIVTAFSIPAWADVEVSGMYCKTTTGIQLYDNGQLMSCTSSDNLNPYKTLRNSVQVRSRNGKVWVSVEFDKLMEFYSDGKVKSIVSGEKKIRIQGHKVLQGNKVTFDEKGQVTSVVKN